MQLLVLWKFSTKSIFFGMWLNNIEKICGKLICPINQYILSFEYGFFFRRDQFMEELENEELNRELCALAFDDMFESWSPEFQEQVLAEWNDWVCSVNFFKRALLALYIVIMYGNIK